MNTSPHLCAVVVAYFPDASFGRRIQAIVDECVHIIIVDNGSVSGELAGLLSECVEILVMPRNLGLATALNRGLQRAIQLGFYWAITFDQDSTPRAGMAKALWISREAYPEPGRVAVVGPRLREERVMHEDHRWVVPHALCWCFFNRVPCLENDLSGVTFVITSGALIDLEIFKRIGPMDEGLFIDYIDHDYCMRARRLGYEILVSAGALLVHNLGAKREFSIAGKAIRPTFHSALRLRYMFRNRWTLLRRHGWRFPHWALFDCIFVHYNLLRILIYENHRRVKLMAAVRGTWDGVSGRSGEIAAK